MKYMYFNTSFSADMFYPCCGDDFVVQQVWIFRMQVRSILILLFLSFIFTYFLLLLNHSRLFSRMPHAKTVETIFLQYFFCVDSIIAIFF